MSPSHVAEPTYDAIRKRLMVGVWPMGHRLESARLAEDLGVSITPVRDSLNRLVGEKLVELVPGIGFHVPRLTERILRDLLDLNLRLLLSAVRTTPSIGYCSFENLNGETHADRTGSLFAQIASLSENTELVETVRSIGDRLHASREHEIAILPFAADEVELIQIVAASRPADLVGALVDYHDVRTPHLYRFLGRLQIGSAT